MWMVFGCFLGTKPLVSWWIGFLPPSTWVLAVPRDPGNSQEGKRIHHRHRIGRMRRAPKHVRPNDPWEPGGIFSTNAATTKWQTKTARKVPSGVKSCEKQVLCQKQEGMFLVCLFFLFSGKKKVINNTINTCFFLAWFLTSDICFMGKLFESNFTRFITLDNHTKPSETSIEPPKIRTSKPSEKKAPLVDDSLTQNSCVWLFEVIFFYGFYHGKKSPFNSKTRTWKKQISQKMEKSSQKKLEPH